MNNVSKGIFAKYIIMLCFEPDNWYLRYTSETWVNEAGVAGCLYICVLNVCVPLCVAQLYPGCEWNKVLVATAGEEVITLNVGHLGEARGLIISLNASGFPMFSPYTHCWPMTHQPSILIVNRYYITVIVKHHVGRLEGKPPAPHHLSFQPFLRSDVHFTWAVSIWRNTAHAMHSSSMMYKNNLFTFI